MDSCQRTCESYVQAYSKPWLSAFWISSSQRVYGGSGRTVTPKLSAIEAPVREGTASIAPANQGLQTGVTSAVEAARTPSTTKPIRPSPGSENVAPTSGVPATIASEAHMFTKPTAA